MEFSAKQIAEYIQGVIVGDENATVHTFANRRRYSGRIIFSLESEIYTLHLRHTIVHCSGK